MEPVEFWEDRYAGRAQIWSGKANAALVQLAGDLAPGRVLDLGCGEGGDALWLARHGWQVTAVDISTIAVERGRAAAADAGVDDRIDWQARDLATWQPEGPYDLVSAFFLHSPVELPRGEILRRAATAVAPGGHLLVVAHAAPPPWWKPEEDGHHSHEDLPSPAEELETLALPAGEWDTLLAEVRPRPVTDPDGRPAELLDGVVLVRRKQDNVP